MTEQKKRRQRTDAERIADLEAQLEAVRNKGRIKDQKRLEVLQTARVGAAERFDKAEAKLKAVDQEIAQIQERLNAESE